MRFQPVIDEILLQLEHAPAVYAARWQSMDVSDKPHMSTFELLNYTVKWDLGEHEDLKFYQDEIKPNLPWADDHFTKERVSGDPINPGTTWRDWPYASSADKHRRPGEDDPQFDHSYAERYWPKFAGKTKGGLLESDVPSSILKGVRFAYGDLDDLVDLLSREPTTRQAFLPVWFPEDLGAIAQGKRVPCSLGYHFIMRAGTLHVVYYIRSCDFVRHFRDDVYLTIRLLLWVLEQCRLANVDPMWDDVKPGTLTMHITSLHIFQADNKFLFTKS